MLLILSIEMGYQSTDLKSLSLLYRLEAKRFKIKSLVPLGYIGGLPNKAPVRFSHQLN